MPFGLCNALAMIQHLINDIFWDFLDCFLIIYLDDILIYSRHHQEQVQHVQVMLLRLQDNCLFANLEKCAFDLTTVDFLGHCISPAGIEMDPGKIDTILQWQTPQTVKDIQPFLGFVNYYQWFISHFAQLMVSLSELLKGKRPF